MQGAGKYDPLDDIPQIFRLTGEERKQGRSMMVKRDEVHEAEDVAEDATTVDIQPKAKKAKPNGHSKPAKAAKAKAAPKPAKAAKAAKGPAKPSKAMPKDQFGYREGSLKSKAAALYSHKKGATLEEVKEKLGSVQLNVLTELEGRNFKIKKIKEAGDGTRQVTRYFLTP